MTGILRSIMTWIRACLTGESPPSGEPGGVCRVEDTGGGTPEPDAPMTKGQGMLNGPPVASLGGPGEAQTVMGVDIADLGAVASRETDGVAIPATTGETVVRVMDHQGNAPGGGISPGIYGETISATAATTETVSTPEGWEVHPGRDPTFEKVGRAYLEDGDLVIRLDKDPRTFTIREHDLDRAMTDGEGKVRTTGNARPVGLSRIFTSGRALNIVIDETLYTIPLRWLMLVLSRKRRKAAVWKGK